MLVVDRYSYSRIAYSSAQGLDLKWCETQEQGLSTPDLVIFLEIEEKVAAQRSGYGFERYENPVFQTKVREQCNKLFENN